MVFSMYGKHSYSSAEQIPATKNTVENIQIWINLLTGASFLNLQTEFTSPYFTAPIVSGDGILNTYKHLATIDSQQNPT